MHPNKILNIKQEYNTIATQFVLRGGITYIGWVVDTVLTNCNFMGVCILNNI